MLWLSTLPDKGFENFWRRLEASEEPENDLASSSDHVNCVKTLNTIQTVEVRKSFNLEGLESSSRVN